MGDGNPPSAGERLDSWKEIAVYLKRDVRTVQRWEKKEGLPVHRHPHDKQGSIYAFKVELDTWWADGHHRLSHELKLELEEQPAATLPAASPQLEQASPIVGAGASAESAGSEVCLPAKPTAPTHTAARKWTIAVATVILLAAAGWALWHWVYVPWRRTATVSPALNARRPARLFGRAASEEDGLVLIPLSAQPDSAAITPDGREIYISNISSGTVTVFNTTSNVVTNVIPVGQRPHALVAAPDGTRVYVGHHGGDVSVISTRDKIVSVISAGGLVEDLAVTPDGRRLYLAMLQGGLKRIDTATQAATQIPSGRCPAHVAVSPDGRRLYVSYQGSGPGGRSGHDAIDVFDLPTEKVVDTIRDRPNVGGPIAISPDSAQVWVNGVNACFVPAYDHDGCPAVPGSVLHVIRAADNAVQTIGSPGNPFDRISFTPDGGRLLASRPGQSLEVLDTATFTVLETLPIPDSGTVVFTPDGKRAYVLLSSRKALAVFETANETCPPEVSGLMARWTGDGTANDARGMIHGRLEGGAGFAPGHVGQAFLLDGRAAAVSVGTVHLSAYSQGEFTVAAWVKFKALGSAPGGSRPAVAPIEMSILDTSRDREIQPRWRLFKQQDNRFALCLGGDSANGCDAHASMASQRVAVPGVWFHVAAVRSFGGLSLYVDGALEGVTAAPFRGHSAEAPSRLLLGSNPRPGAFLNGLIDEVEFYNRALTATEIQAVFKSAANPACW